MDGVDHPNNIKSIASLHACCTEKYPEKTGLTQQDTPVAFKKPILRLSSDAAYILTGGFGGLGRSIATWLIEHGARHLVFLSRSANSDPRNLKFCKELESLGCSIYSVAGEVSNYEDVCRAINAPPCSVRGVIHLASVLRVSTC